MIPMSDSFLVDTHCHIDLFQDPVKVVAETDEHRVFTIAVTNAPLVYRHTADLVSGSRYIRPAAGLHPELVATHGDQLEMLPELLNETRYVGEIGLDYSVPDGSGRIAQRKTLGRILEWCSADGSKILTLHSRRAATDVISALGTSFSKRSIFHWFSGTNKELEKACSLDCFFSVNLAMISSAKGANLISRMPVDRVLTESDGPFVKVHGEQARPANIGRVIDKLASIWGTQSDEARHRVYRNFRTLLGSGVAGE